MNNSDSNQQLSPLKNKSVSESDIDYSLRSHVEDAINNYFQVLDGQTISNLYEIVLSEVEEPLLRTVMHNTQNNQSKTATILGLSRGTLRKKLELYGII